MPYGKQLRESGPGTGPGAAPPPPGVPRRRPGALLALTRPYQWVKNLLVLAIPLMQPSRWTDDGLARLLWAVALFTLASAAVYVGNDLVDRDRDRVHPVKRHRPVASGAVSVPAATALGAVLVGAVAAGLVLQPWLALPLVGYVAMNLFYSLKGKHLAIVDVYVVAAGFLFRIAAGALAIGATLRSWLVPLAFLLCLLLALGKRRQEFDAAGSGHRPVLGQYSRSLLDQLLTLAASSAAVTLALYVEHDLAGQGLAALALLPVGVFAMARYLQQVSAGGGADPLKTMLGDQVLVAAVAVAVVLVAVSQYPPSGGLGLELLP